MSLRPWTGPRCHLPSTSSSRTSFAETNICARSREAFVGHHISVWILFRSKCDRRLILSRSRSGHWTVRPRVGQLPVRHTRTPWNSNRRSEMLYTSGITMSVVLQHRLACGLHSPGSGVYRSEETAIFPVAYVAYRWILRPCAWHRVLYRLPLRLIDEEFRYVIVLLPTACQLLVPLYIHSYVLRLTPREVKLNK